MKNKDFPNSSRELKTWCVDSEKRVVKMIDKIFDNTDTSDPIIQKMLIESAEILKEIEQLETEVDTILNQ